MATLGLSTAGSLAGASFGPFGALIGGIAGSLIGSYIDKTFLEPYLFPTTKSRPDRLDEIQVSHQDEGAPANWIVGGTPRVEGMVIWQSEIRAVKVEEDSGGKGGGGDSQVVGYRYFCDFAIAISIGQQITQVDKIIVEGQTLYNRSPDITISDSVLSVTVVMAGAQIRMRIDSPAGGPDLSVLVPNKFVTVSGFANAGNNGVGLKVKASSRDRATGASWVQIRNATAVAEAAGNAVTITQDLDTFDPSRVESIEIYTGTLTQTADPVIEAIEGVGNVSGYRRVAYVVLKNMDLGPYGNRSPQAFNFVVTGAASTVQAAISALVVRAGRDTSEIDVTGVSASLGGQSISGPTPPASGIQPLLIAYDILTQETNGVMRFFPRRSARIIDIPEEDLAANSGGTFEFPIAVSDTPDSKIVSDVVVDYFDSENENQKGAQTEPQGRFAQRDVSTVSLPLVMTGAQARAIARRFRWLAWNQREVKLQLPTRWKKVQENDCLRFKAMGEQWLVLVKRVDVGKDEVVYIEATIELRDVLIQAEEAESPTYGSPQQYVPGDTDGEAVEIPPIGEWSTGIGHNVPMVTVSCTKDDPESLWRPTGVFQGRDDVEFAPMLTLQAAATRGSATTALGGTGIDPEVIDYVSTVDVMVSQGTLETRTESEMLSGFNRAMIGDEIVGFVTATLIGDNEYRLSGLLRGLCDTMDEMTTHAAGERFLYLNGGGVAQVPFMLTWIGMDRFFRFVPSGGAMADYDSQQLAITGASLRPFSPSPGEILRNDAGDVTLTWHRRSRIPTNTLSVVPPPLSEQTESYEIDVFDLDAPGTVLRTITATSETLTYTAAQQTDDGFTAFEEVGFRIYQLSEIFGRGKALEVTG